MWKKGVLLGVSHAPAAEGRAPVPALPNFAASLLLMHTPFDAKLPNLTW